MQGVCTLSQAALSEREEARMCVSLSSQALVVGSLCHIQSLKKRKGPVDALLWRKVYFGRPVFKENWNLRRMEQEWPALDSDLTRMTKRSQSCVRLAT